MRRCAGAPVRTKRLLRTGQLRRPAGRHGPAGRRPSVDGEDELAARVAGVAALLGRGGFGQRVPPGDRYGQVTRGDPLRHPGHLGRLDHHLGAAGEQHAVLGGVRVGDGDDPVGTAAQRKAIKKVSGRMKLDLAQYRDLEAFAAFASDLDKTSRAQLDRGARPTELLKQDESNPFPYEEEVVSIWTGTTGKLDSVPVSDVSRFEREFLAYLRHNHKQVMDEIASTGAMSDDATNTLESAVAKFTQNFLAGSDELTVNEAPAEALAEGSEGQETVQKYVPAGKK